jgi:hypothetical protein
MEEKEMGWESWKRVKGQGRDGEWKGSKAQTKVLMCCSQSQLVLALPGSLASGAYWCVTTSRLILDYFPGLRARRDYRGCSRAYI